MKNLMIIFAVAALVLAGCKNQTDGLASSPMDDVYYNPAKDRKPNVPPQPEQYANNNTNAPYDRNAGKIGATAADQNNPYYKDPNFNYDDYYDNAYASRIRRFNNPIYGTGYYDSYNTNSYFYNSNPTSYGTSIYSSYNMGYGNGMYGNSGWGGGYYSPSTSFWNSYYNPYYNGFGNGYGMGYGTGMSMGYGMGNMYGSNPYSMCGTGYGYGGYNPYAYGMGYSPYNYSPYGYGYGMGMGYGGYSSPMTNYGGYYNSYDHNSSSYSNYGPRGTHSGGNSTTTSPMPQPHHMEVKQSQFDGPAGTSPYAMDRFSQVSIPQEHFNKIVEAKNPMSNNLNNMMYQPANMNGGGGRPAYNNGGGNPGYNGGVYNNGGSYTAPSHNNGGNYNSPSYNNGGAVKTNTESAPERPHKWFNVGTDNGGGTFNNSSTPTRGDWNSGGGRPAYNNGGNSGSGGNSGGGGGGAVSRPHR